MHPALPPEQLDQLAALIADRVVEQLQSDSTEAGRLIDAAEIARRFSVSRDYVYEHADDLGAVRLGSGPKARLRFSSTKVAEALGSSTESESQPKRVAVRPVRRGHGVTLLPIRGESP